MCRAIRIAFFFALIYCIIYVEINKEHNVLKILMRTDYRFASDHSGVITNIFRFDRDWQKPDNFLLIETLYFLVMNRKRTGQIGLEGYWTCRHLAEALERFGYIPVDTLLALNYLLRRQLITADHLNYREVSLDDSVRISASGFMHLRVLPTRLEYLFGVLPTTPFLDGHTAQRMAEYVKRENSRGYLSAVEKARAVEVFYSYLFDLNNHKGEATICSRKHRRNIGPSADKQCIAELLAQNPRPRTRLRAGLGVKPIKLRLSEDSVAHRADSATGRRRIAAAQRAMWAKVRPAKE